MKFDGEFFDKEYIKGKRFDYLFGKRLEIEGEFLNGEIWNEKVIKYRNNILVDEKEFLNGKKIKGKIYDSSGKLEFEGEYLNGERNGKGKNIIIMAN